MQTDRHTDRRHRYYYHAVSRMVHFSLKIWHLVATILIISSIVKRLLWRASPLARGARFYLGGRPPAPLPPLAPALSSLSVFLARTDTHTHTRCNKKRQHYCSNASMKKKNSRMSEDGRPGVSARLASRDTKRTSALFIRRTSPPRTYIHT